MAGLGEYSAWCYICMCGDGTLCPALWNDEVHLNVNINSLPEPAFHISRSRSETGTSHKAAKYQRITDSLYHSFTSLSLKLPLKMLALILLALTRLWAFSAAHEVPNAHELAARLDASTNPSSPSYPTQPTIPDSPFTLTYAFTFTITIAPLLPQIQPPNSNGTFAVIPDVGGTITGPLLNGTITRGLGWASRFTNYYLEESVNFGVTDDGLEFFLRDTGVGNAEGKVDRVVSTYSVEPFH